MFVGTLTVELIIPGCNGLKDKRKVIRSIQDKLKAKFNIAIAELEYQDKWQRSTIGLCTINSRKSEIELTLLRISEILNDSYNFMVIKERNNIDTLKEY
ncbi:DUF503 domain-containing protein [bacterium]|nr:DUF503 domain-containing protein [bacterium]